MARMIHNHSSFEGRTLYELTAAYGTPSIVATEAKFGLYSLLMETTGDHSDFPLIEIGESDQGDYHFVEFWVFYTDSTPLNNSTWFRMRGSSVSNCDFSFGLMNDGDFRLVDANSSQIGVDASGLLTDSTWHRIRVTYQRSNTGNIKVWIDDTLAHNATSQDLLATTPTGYMRWSGMVNSEDYYIDGVYTGSGGDGSIDDFLVNANFLEVYQNTAEDATDQGSTLNSGTWADASELPIGDTNFARYSTGGAVGHTRTDEGSRLGPGAYSGTPKAAKWFFRARKPATVSATVHKLRMGKYVAADTYTDQTIAPTTAWDQYIYNWDASTRAWTPDNGDEFVAGMSIDSGGESLDISDFYCQLLVDVTEAAAPLGGIARGVARGVMEGIG